MPLDAVFLQGVANELRPQITGLRVEKIHQPARDQIILSLRGGLQLLLCAGANAPRIQLTHIRRENPSVPPMFCMLLRKHLSGGKIVALEQPELERMIRLEIEALDELGQPGRRSLILEAMGRRSNLILLDADGRIIDCLRRVDSEMSASRQVLPGLYYQPPAAAGRLPVSHETPEGFLTRLNAALQLSAVRAEKFLLDEYFGISPLLAREITFRAFGDTDAVLSRENMDTILYGDKNTALSGNIDALPGELSGAERFQKEFCNFLNAMENNHFTPVCLKRDGKPVEFSCFPVLQYGAAMECIAFPDFSALLDDYYEVRERLERARTYGAELFRTVTAVRERLRRKLALQERDYAAALKRDEWRIRGDLITANLYRMERGQKVLTCENFYDDSKTVSIPLDPLLSPQKNAAQYYKRYTKARTAEKYLREQMEQARRDMDYLESVLDELERGESEQDFAEIRRELSESGFLRSAQSGGKRSGNVSQSGGKHSSGGKNHKKTSGQFRPREFFTSSGLRVSVGRNNRQNDALTKQSGAKDIWLHTQKIHGSHVILHTDGHPPSQTDITEAAQIAACFSQARESSQVPVDYTSVRNVKKPSGARPGMVIYSAYHTVYVTPRSPETEQ